MIKVSKNADESLLPSYYKAQNLEVENYFLIDDLRQLVSENFSLIRDEFLSNFITPNAHTYAIYGNNYVYPLIVRQKRFINYFETQEKHFLSIFKSPEYLALQDIFKNFIFGERLFYRLHPDTISNLISAELELEQNKSNAMYDFTSVVVKYSKSMEAELYHFAKALLAVLVRANDELLSISYEVQNMRFTLKDFFTQKPNIGTVKFLLLKPEITGLVSEKMKKFILSELKNGISFLQTLRNKSVHEKAASLEEVLILRDKILGIEQKSLLKSLILAQEF